MYRETLSNYLVNEGKVIINRDENSPNATTKLSINLSENASGSTITIS